MPMMSVPNPIYQARFAESAVDIAVAQRLRARVFRPGAADDADADRFDDRCRHVLVEHIGTGALACCFRLLPLASGADIAQSYGAQFYDLSRLAHYHAPMLEVGRFCCHPKHRDPDILRAAWAVITANVDVDGVEMLFGCSSFPGTDPGAYLQPFALLQAGHLAPERWRPRVKAAQVFRFAAVMPEPADPRRGRTQMPGLLRSYLAMGGWVSDHAVIDPELKTLHVFTGLEIRAIPPARARLLRADAQAAQPAAFAQPAAAVQPAAAAQGCLRRECLAEKNVH